GRRRWWWWRAAATNGHANKSALAGVDVGAAGCVLHLDGANHVHVGVAGASGGVSEGCAANQGIVQTHEISVHAGSAIDVIAARIIGRSRPCEADVASAATTGE